MHLESHFCCNVSEMFVYFYNSSKWSSHFFHFLPKINELFQVSPNSTLDQTICECTHLTNFASEFLVAPNIPDFTVWSNPGDLFRNPAVATFCLGIIMLYIILAVWARRKDNYDQFKVSSIATRVS